jgi:hypothetical protein
MARPTAFDGLELDPVSMFRVVEEGGTPRQRRRLDLAALARRRVRASLGWLMHARRRSSADIRR